MKTSFIKKAGLSAVIAASSVALPAASGLTPVITSAYAAKIKLSTTSKTMTRGQTYTLKVKGSKKKTKWSSSKKSVATVSSKGKVTAKKKGTVYIYAKVAGKRLKCRITVNNPASSTSSSTSNSGSSSSSAAKDSDTTISISSSNGNSVETYASGVTITNQLTAHVSSTTLSDKSVSWTSSNPQAVIVDENGLCYPHGSGNSTITATTKDGKSASIVIKSLT